MTHSRCYKNFSQTNKLFLKSSSPVSLLGQAGLDCKSRAGINRTVYAGAIRFVNLRRTGFTGGHKPDVIFLRM